MTRKIIKPKIPEHIIILDTNIIWHKDKTVVVAPEFQEFWDKHSPKFPMKLCIPEVVKGELLYQQTTSALKLLNRANENIEQISSITNRKYSHRISEARIRRQVKERFNKWVQHAGAEIILTPVDEVDWSKIIENSIWRVLPFTADAKNPTNEKGFRDAMILEALVSVCKNYHKEYPIAFLCDDYALRTSSERRLRTYEKLSCYESIKAFSSFIELTHKDLTESFVKLIFEKAKTKFYSNSADCLINKFSIISKISEQFSEKLNNPKDELYSLSNLRFDMLSSWEPSDREQVWIVAPTYDRLEGKDTYHWISEILMVRPFKRKSSSSYMLSNNVAEERLRIIKVAVKWSAEVKLDARFYKCKINNIEEAAYSFNEPTPEEARRYGLNINKP